MRRIVPARPHLVVVTGTSIDVGKSTLTKAIALALIARGARVVAIKPVEVWCDRGAPGSEDGESLAATTGQRAPREALVRLRPSAAPALAADMEGQEIAWPDLLREVRRHAEGHDVALVESVGGACTPITWQHDYLDLARDLGAPVLLVGSDHIQGAAAAIMAMRATAAADVPLLGVAMNVAAAADFTTGSNAAVVRRFTGFERVVTVRNVRAGGSESDPAALLAIAARLEAVQRIAGWVLEPDGAQRLTEWRRPAPAGGG
jgi:dethiobiotin synthetase